MKSEGMKSEGMKSERMKDGLGTEKGERRRAIDTRRCR